MYIRHPTEPPPPRDLDLGRNPRLETNDSIKEVHLVDCAFSVVCCCFSNAICNWNPMIKQLVSNVGILPRTRKFSMGLFTSRTTHPQYSAWEHTRGPGRSHEFPYCTHSWKIIVSIISRWGLVLMTYILSDMQDANRIDEIRPNVCP